MVKFWRIAPMVVSGLLAAAPALAQQQPYEPQAEPPFGAQIAPGEEVQSGQAGVPLTVGPSGIQQIQQALSQRGFEIEADGQWNEQTAEAVREFQRQEGLDPSGDLTASTIQALGIDMEGLGAEARRAPQQAETPRGEPSVPAIPEAEREGPNPAQPQLD